MNAAFGKDTYMAPPKRGLPKIGNGRLTAHARQELPLVDFALPGRRYPIENPDHARAALSMVARYGSPAEQAHVRQKVHNKYPGIK